MVGEKSRIWLIVQTERTKIISKHRLFRADRVSASTTIPNSEFVESVTRKSRRGVWSCSQKLRGAVDVGKIMAFALIAMTQSRWIGCRECLAPSDAPTAKRKLTSTPPLPVTEEDTHDGSDWIPAQSNIFPVRSNANGFSYRPCSTPSVEQGFSK